MLFTNIPFFSSNENNTSTCTSYVGDTFGVTIHSWCFNIQQFNEMSYLIICKILNINLESKKAEENS